ncbi:MULTISPECIES: AAA family ATPase [unclassified Leifsonia]|uniref:AAA family ATPase n=1 Tax=unclassified Leifsonia TaxID=2663824 RepID=UPI00070002D0|nr:MULTISPECIES: AAA family ATPase [unclassified Leifsonia]KQX06739.1 AAA family ATPase [Leifsonia sp. Root1293]KRA11023.1 AAA family ATPase [Leifsonia sp. Root60]
MNAADDWLHDSRAVRRVSVYPDADITWDSWPASIPAVGQFLREGGREFASGLTLLVGENGSGKSTLIEGIAMACGLPPEGGSTQGQHSTRQSESPLSEWLRIERSPSAPRWGFFLRAETMHGYYSYLESLPSSTGSDLHEMSHGESFNRILDDKLNHPDYTAGLVCLDEPEAALSFGSSLRWISGLAEALQRGTQVICATHSPILASFPGATVLELGEWGIRESEWEDLELVGHWRSYLDDPRRYLRHLLE